MIYLQRDDKNLKSVRKFDNLIYILCTAELLILGKSQFEGSPNSREKKMNNYPNSLPDMDLQTGILLQAKCQIGTQDSAATDGTTRSRRMFPRNRGLRTKTSSSSGRTPNSGRNGSRFPAAFETEQTRTSRTDGSFCRDGSASTELFRVLGI